MAFGDGADDALATMVGGHATLNLVGSGSCRRQVGFVDHNNVRNIQHGNLLKLEPTAIIGAHYQHGFVHEFAIKGHRLLTDAYRFDQNHIEAKRAAGAVFQYLQASH